MPYPKGRWAAALTALFLAAVLPRPALAQAGLSLEERVRQCAGCHGADGNSTIPGTPSLAGQPRVFLENYLVMTREGIRGTAVMQALLKDLPDADIVALSKHYASLAAAASVEPADRKLFERGRQVAAKNRCGSCHLPTYRGREQMPRLAGQREEFLLEVMLQYRQNRRPGGDTLMAAALYGLPEEDFKAMAHYFARLK